MEAEFDTLVCTNLAEARRAVFAQCPAKRRSGILARVGARPGQVTGLQGRSAIERRLTVTTGLTWCFPRWDGEIRALIQAPQGGYVSAYDNDALAPQPLPIGVTPRSGATNTGEPRGPRRRGLIQGGAG